MHMGRNVYVLHRRQSCLAHPRPRLLNFPRVIRFAFQQSLFCSPPPSSLMMHNVSLLALAHPTRSKTSLEFVDCGEHSVCVMQADQKRSGRQLWSQLSNMRLAQRLINALQDEDLSDISACENLLESYFAQACPLSLPLVSHFPPVPAHLCFPVRDLIAMLLRCKLFGLLCTNSHLHSGCRWIS